MNIVTLIHRVGLHFLPVDFIGVPTPENPDKLHRPALLLGCFLLILGAVEEGIASCHKAKDKVSSKERKLDQSGKETCIHMSCLSRFCLT